MKNLLVIIALPLLLGSCNFGGERVDGNGTLATESRQVSAFKNVASSGPMDVVLKQASGRMVQIKGDQNLLPYIVTETEGETLKIKIREDYNLHPKKHLVVYVTSPEFTAISMGGSGDVSTENTLTNADKLVFSLSGSGNIEAKVNTLSLESHTSGSGDVTFSGKADDAAMTISGSGDIHCFSLTSENASVSINGSGDADVYATKQLTLKVNGSGDVRYKGGASVDSHINGSGSVSKAD